MAQTQITIRLNQKKKDLPEFLCPFMFYVPDKSVVRNKDYTEVRTIRGHYP